jgi:hypothetical protein
LDPAVWLANTMLEPGFLTDEKKHLKNNGPVLMIPMPLCVIAMKVAEVKLTMQ